MSLNHKNETREIKEFWDSRAKQYGEACQATLGEVKLRKLEIKTMINYIRKYSPSNILDVGCGNGYSTIEYAQKFPSINFYGVDYSYEMIKLAKINTLKNCFFDTADVLDISSLPKKKFEMIITQRCLQNLPDYKKQYEAINNLISFSSVQLRIE